MQENHNYIYNKVIFINCLYQLIYRSSAAIVLVKIKSFIFFKEYIPFLEQSKCLAFMAFVFRSDRFDIFQSANSKSQVQQVQEAQEKCKAIHCKDQQNHPHKFTLLKDRAKYCSEPSIPKSELHETNTDKQQKEKTLYDFRLLKKIKQYYKSTHQNQASNSHNIDRFMIGKDATQIKKYIKKKRQNKKNINTNRKDSQVNILSSFTPGPGFYNPLLKNTVPSPKFNFPHVRTIKNVGDEQQSDSEEQQASFSVRYDQTNSKNFKKSLNLVSQSNKNLLRKIFYERNNSQIAGTEIQKTQIQYQQYKLVNEPENPGPCQYSFSHKRKERSHLFSKEKRFKIKLLSSPSKFYDKKYPDEFQYVHIFPNFSSPSKRFEEIKQTDCPLQYQNYEDSMIKNYKNKKRVPFDFVIQRSGKEKLDQRPYYDLTLREKGNIIANFSRYTSAKGLFNDIQKQGPSPASYQIFPKWQKQHSLVIKQKSKDSWKENQSLNYKPNFYLCSQQSIIKEQQLTEANFQPKQIIKKQSSCKINLKSKENGNKPNFQFTNYQASKNLNWQKKSFNTNFSFEPLRANNPIKNKIL